MAVEEKLTFSLFPVHQAETNKCFCFAFSDQEIVRHCTTTQDTECQCKPGTFCAPDQACELCMKCSMWVYANQMKNTRGALIVEFVAGATHFSVGKMLFFLFPSKLGAKKMRKKWGTAPLPPTHSARKSSSTQTLTQVQDSVEASSTCKTKLKA